jgi:peptidyl-tRNA hydrolase
MKLERPRRCAGDDIVSTRSISAMCLGWCKDELDLPPGAARPEIRGGGVAGHNGLKDYRGRGKVGLIFWRLRLGIGHPRRQRNEVANYVLHRRAKTETQLISRRRRAQQKVWPNDSSTGDMEAAHASITY